MCYNLCFQLITMGEPDIDQPLSPVVSVGMVTYISTPSSSISDMNMDSESEKRAQTPMKCMGHLYYGQQHKTPCMSSPSWLGLTQSSPSIKTPGSSASGNRMKSLANHHTPSSKHSSKKVYCFMKPIMYLLLVEREKDVKHKQFFDQKIIPVTSTTIFFSLKSFI